VSLPRHPGEEAVKRVMEASREEPGDTGGVLALIEIDEACYIEGDEAEGYGTEDRIDT
jgi:hypothetical protein